MTAESRPLEDTPGAGFARLAGSTLFAKLAAALSHQFAADRGLKPTAAR